MLSPLYRSQRRVVLIKLGFALALLALVLAGCTAPGQVDGSVDAYNETDHRIELDVWLTKGSATGPKAWEHRLFVEGGQRSEKVPFAVRHADYVLHAAYTNASGVRVVGTSELLHWATWASESTQGGMWVFEREISIFRHAK